MEGRLKIASSSGISAFVRNQIGGWFYGLLDADRFGITHRLLVGIGIYVR